MKIACLTAIALLLILFVGGIVALYVFLGPTKEETKRMNEIMKKYNGKYSHELKRGDDQYVDIRCIDCLNIDKKEACDIYKKFRSFDGKNEKPIRSTSYYIFNYFNKSDEFLFQILFYEKSDCRILEGKDTAPYY